MNRFPDMPSRMKHLPVDKRGFPVPKFVRWINSEPDFRVMDPNHLHRCVRLDQCWICGAILGRNKAFVIGPMCCINRVSSEPPSHHQCAEFAAKNRPFLTRPLAKRADRSDLPETHSAGFMIEHIPGVGAIWTTRSYKPFRAGDGILFGIGEPEHIEFYAHGRTATRAEINESVRTGLPFLIDMAGKEGEGAFEAVARQQQRFETLLQGMGI